MDYLFELLGIHSAYAAGAEAQIESMWTAVMVSVVSSLIMGAVNVFVLSAVLKTEIKWLKDILMTRPCLDSRGHSDS